MLSEIIIQFVEETIARRAIKAREASLPPPPPLATATLPTHTSAASEEPPAVEGPVRGKRKRAEVSYNEYSYTSYNSTSNTAYVWTG